MRNQSIFLLRHAEPDSSRPSIRDGARLLSRRGREQANRLGTRWKERAPFGKIFCSPAFYAQETANTAVGFNEKLSFESLYTYAGREDRVHEMFKKLGEVPLRTYQEHHDYHLLNDLGHDSAEQIRWVVTGGVERDILIVGHHIILQITAHHLIRHPAVYEFALGTVLPHCGMMQIKIGNTEEDVSVRIVDA